MSTAAKNSISALFSTIGKKSGMMTDVTTLAMIVYMVSEPMLPPSFSVTTGAAAAVGQMIQINIPSSRSFTSASEVNVISHTKNPDKAMRMPWRIKCHVRGFISFICILQKVT